MNSKLLVIVCSPWRNSNNLAIWQSSGAGEDGRRGIILGFWSLLQVDPHRIFWHLLCCEAVAIISFSSGSPRDRPGHAHSCQTCVSRGSPVWEDPLFGRTRNSSEGHSGPSQRLGGNESVVGMENLPIRRKSFVLPFSITSIMLYTFSMVDFI